jgi:hypothetical protein
MLARPLPEPPAKGWWTELKAAAEEAEFDQWVDEIAADLRAERIEGLKALAHRVDMRCAGAVARDQWERSQRRAELRGAVRHPGGMLVNQTGAREVEHSGHWGQVLDVQ